MILEWPQITMIVLTLIGFGIACNQHSKVDLKPRSVWMWMAGATVQWFLLIMGGFLG